MIPLCIMPCVAMPCLTMPHPHQFVGLDRVYRCRSLIVTLHVFINSLTFEF